MTRVEAYNILGDLWYEVTSKEAEAINIAQDAIQFVDLMPKDMVAVVRCSVCKHWEKGGFMGGKTLDSMEFGGRCPFAKFSRYESDFCSRGERKDGEGK